MDFPEDFLVQGLGVIRFGATIKALGRTLFQARDVPKPCLQV